jgi:hypothetical protein
MERGAAPEFQIFPGSGSSCTAGAPAAPTNLSATAVSASQINLSWTASTTSGVTYSVFASTTSGFTPSASNQIASGLAGTTYSNTGLAASTKYYYVVQAVNCAGAASSSQASATTQSGSSGSALLQIDAGGGATGTFVADEFFNNGNEYSTTTAVSTSGVTNPAPEAVYQSVCWAPSFNYIIPGLTSGSSYTVRLHFAELSFTAAGQRVFNVAINGTQVLTNFDVFATAGGEFKAVVEQFPATANALGQIVISFSSTASIDTSHTYNPAPAAVYQTCRWASSFNYTIPGLTPNANYAVRLHFAELTWTAAGQRVFNVAINGAAVLSNFDIFATSGAQNRALTEEFSAVASSSGAITIVFTQGSADNPEVNGIEVVP